MADPPANITPDPELERWFKSLKQPTTGHLCCSVSDCRFIPFTVRGKHYEVEIEGWVYRVPSNVIIRGIANPTGKAVACYTYKDFGPPFPPGVPRDRPQDTIEILCFVPPGPVS